MVRTVGHEEIADAADGLQLVEVLGAEEYERIHIAGAESLPLTMLNRDTVERLDSSKPVAVYCWDAY
ncbi:MAG: hypothetical protein R3A46_21890 [Thermomicrobiales bacterium]